MNFPSHPLPGIPGVESPIFDQLFGPATTDADTLRVARDRHELGFAVIDFPDPEIDFLCDKVCCVFAGAFDFEAWRVSQGNSLRVQDAWKDNEAVRRIACNRKVLALLTRLYGRRAWPLLTRNFPVGTQQLYHTDCVHFSSMPERFMCGVWLAKEATDDDNGPLVYYPGSHRWPVYTSEHIGRRLTDTGETPTQQIFEPDWRALVESSGVQPKYFHARKGQALIWAANLMHGGAKQRDPQRTRWSQVTHYYFDNCAYYTPLMSDPVIGRIDFRRLVDISTGQVMPNRFAGEDVPQNFIEAARGGLWQALGGFDAQAYLAANPDVAKAGVNAAEHFLMHGFRERRRLR